MKNIRLKVLLINPPRVDGFAVVREERFEHKDIGSVYPPLSLLYIASMLCREEYLDVKLIDANGLDLSMNAVRAEIISYAPDVVLIRCGFDTQKQDIEVLKIARDLNAVTVLRNKIISEVPGIRDKILKSDPVDVFINGEPETVVSGLMKAVLDYKKEKLASPQPGICLYDTDCRTKDDWNFLSGVHGISYYFNGQVITTHAAAEFRDINKLPFPAYEMLPDLKAYHTGVMQPPFALVQTTRGCPFGCVFCAYGKTVCRERNVDCVIEELKYIKETFGIKSFLFFDDTISIKGGRVKELAQKMIDEKLDTLEWVCCTRANLVDYEMLKTMKRAGMNEIAIGVETGSQAILDNINKGIKLEDIRQAAKWCRELKIMFYALVIIGLPGETKETVEETVKFIKEIDPFYTQICFAVPFPNTEMYDIYDKKGLILTKDWSKYFPLSEEPVIRTEALSAEELVKLRKWAYRKLLLRPGYLLGQVRPFDWKWNIMGFRKIMQRIKAVLTNKPLR
jgi:radical SAM superfamily enzyme YgiQ (UPF0313 family)